MRRLTLILSDLYLPAEVGPPSEQSDFVALPEFAWLLRYAQPGATRDWRLELAGQSGDTTLAHVAPAHFAAVGQVPGDRLATSWFATPVHLEARLDHVRLPQRGILRLPAEDRRAWCEEFARSFGPELVLHDGGPRGYFLSGLEAHHVISIDPARALGADIAGSLPQGKNSAPLRKLSAEIEMWLHGADLNRARERAGLPRVSSLWLWGGGKGLPPEDVSSRADCAYAGEDPWLRALARAQTGIEPHSVPGRLADFDPNATHGIVELTPMSDPERGLAQVDVAWFGPARAALANGSLEQVDILANDWRFTTRRHSGWRFWRRGRHWIELLRRPHNVSQA